MTIAEAALLGAIEGLTEFFPISSTGHLILAEKFLGIHSASLAFNTIIQVGAIAALFVVYAKEITLLFQQVVHGKFATILRFCLATLPVLVFGFVFHSFISSLHDSVFVVGVMSVCVAMLMWIVQRIHIPSLQKGKAIHNMTIKDALLIGMYQVLSLIPGTSRSGITVIGGLTQGYTFKDATDFAFLLGIPAMGAASLFELLSLMKAPEHMTNEFLTTTLVGFCVAFFVSLVTIRATLPIFQKFKFTPFIVYRIALGIILLAFFR